LLGVAVIDAAAAVMVVEGVAPCDIVMVAVFVGVPLPVCVTLDVVVATAVFEPVALIVPLRVPVAVAVMEGVTLEVPLGDSDVVGSAVEDGDTEPVPVNVALRVSEADSVPV
jgi:hypothetical protein